jgi:hypothetical protein
LSVSKLPLQCAVVSLYSVVKQRMKCNIGKVCNCLIQFLLTMVLSIEERVFISAKRLSECTVLFIQKGVTSGSEVLWSFQGQPSVSEIECKTTER